MALRSDNWPDILDVRFHKIHNEVYKDVDDMLSKFFYFDPGSKPGRESERYSSVGAYGEISEFNGQVIYDDVYQGYDMRVVPLEFASGLQVERKLYDDDQFSIIDQKPKSLSRSLYRIRQTHGARQFNNAFSVDSKFYSHTENVAMCSNSHTTTAPGVSTATGFDNLMTTALSAAAVATARIQMMDFRGDRAERIEVMPTALIFHPTLYETAYEIIGSEGKVDTALNNANVHKGQYSTIEWKYLTDTNNWFMVDEDLMKGGTGLIWLDRNKGEFAFVEDFDTLIGKWRVYARWGNAHLDWRWCLGSQVS
jgi:hypothetical protein